MPTVGAGKKKRVFPYTAKGAKAAKDYARTVKKTKKKKV